MSLKTASELDLSYELYRELAEELCVPVDHKLSREVRYELYKSKLIFLRNLYDQCFRTVNGKAALQVRNEDTYSGDDLRLIHKAMELTNEFLRDTLLEAMREALAKVGKENQRENDANQEDRSHASVS